MNAPVMERYSATKVGGLIIVLTIGWLLFQYLPDPAAKPSAPIVATPPSNLQLVGLPDNVDFEGLPEFFAVWAGHAHWQDGRTKFAYWNPADRDYTYDLEAIRVKEGFRFRVLAEIAGDQTLGEILAEDCPIRFYWPNPVTMDPSSRSLIVRTGAGSFSGKNNPGKVDVNISQPKIDVTPSPVVPSNPALPDPPGK